MKVRMHMKDGRVITAERVTHLSDTVSRGKIRLNTNVEGVRVWYDKEDISVIEIVPEETEVAMDEETQYRLTQLCQGCALHETQDDTICRGCAKVVNGAWTLVNYRPQEQKKEDG